MATIELSAGFVSTGAVLTGLVGRIAHIGGTPGTGTTSTVASYSQSGLLFLGENYLYSTSNISLYSGTVPTSWIPTPYTTYESNLLVRWFPGNNSGSANQYSTVLGSITVTNNILSISTVYKAATASGTATWLMISSHRGDYTAGSLNIPLQQIICTVGTSGTDVLVNDTSIVAGSYYRISNLQIQLPTSWTY